MCIRDRDSIMYNVEISNYKGPFDVLLELIDKEKMDIFDIPINEITEKFLDYINTSDEIDVEMSSDFLVMASRLLEIKSKMLIPVEKDNVEEDPRPVSYTHLQVFIYRIELQN